ncbi:hypothetical protein [Alloalcanivorax xenomutans]|uniref:hypothetical protein n=1 Tax=Alloalcanivorax xenomutans TaxID=1094342 RepID=UPI001F40174A|nr:hypothetical protein [Alloalcanivorax xenomutans]MCE7523039.1 hypothetical protein [Alloalcanivorax xenomutans]
MDINPIAKDVSAWIDDLNTSYVEDRISCVKFRDAFDGFYDVGFLAASYYVVLDEIPTPEIVGANRNVQEMLAMPMDGITYKDTYYVRKGHEGNMALHFHELVHVAQWECLGALRFITRYIEEIGVYKYEEAPLELMAYTLQHCYESKAKRFDVPGHVKNLLINR